MSTFFSGLGDGGQMSLSTRQNQDPVPPKSVSSALIVPFACLIWCVLANYNISHIDLNALMSRP